MKPRSVTMKYAPLDICGSTTFGRYQKISISETYNMLISDNWLVPYAGYAYQALISGTGVGRGLYSSTNYGNMIAVVNNGVYSINPNLTVSFIANIGTFSGDVFMAENNANQIAICDQQALYIFNWKTNSFSVASLPTAPGGSAPIVPAYVTFQDGYFIVPDKSSSFWFLSALNDGTSWNWGAGGAPVDGRIQTKPDTAIAAVRFPGRGNLLLVFGRTVTELWYDQGLQLFPYTRSQSVNIDYGCLSAATIAASDTIVVWLGANEKSGPVIMYTSGGDINRISNDGIDYRLSLLTQPQNSYGFLFKQDGHILYQITWPADNFSLVYDFTTEKFFTLTDEHMNYHIAKRTVFFNNNYFFVSFNDGNLYELSTSFTTYEYANNFVQEIPRVRITKNFRLPDGSRFAVNNSTFTIEQGNGKYNTPDYVLVLATESGNPITTEGGNELLLLDIPNPAPQNVYLSISKNGGHSFGSTLDRPLNTVGNRQNRLQFWNFGVANDIVHRFQFIGFDRFVATDGIISYYQ